ncbi:MAG: phosphoribosylglycinamide formyltransferase [Kiritimatiellia bacterium]|jgi:phosphoribosylglycinamide formyltransferase-1
MQMNATVKPTDKAVLGILGSGQGSNFQAIADAVADGRLSARIACVIADVPNAFILERARRMGIPAFYVDPAPFKTKLEGAAESRVIELLRLHKVDLVALAGFMRIVKSALLQAYPGRIINIHPSLLPSFPGLAAWRQALEYGVKVTGCTVHFVDAGVDTGRIIMQRAVPVHPDDTPDSLHARIQEQEHQVYPEAIARLLAAGLPGG